MDKAEILPQGQFNLKYFTASVLVLYCIVKSTGICFILICFQADQLFALF